MSGMIGGAGSKSGIIGEMGLGVSSATTFQLNGDHTGDTIITDWNSATANLDGAGSVGKVVTVSSGIFTMPTAGVWQVIGIFQGEHYYDDNWTGVGLWVGGTKMIEVFAGYDPTAAGTRKVSNIAMHHIVKIPAVSTTIKFITFSLGASSHMVGLNGWSAGGEQATAVTFIKLGNSSSS